jgi:hypothetical protein
VGIHLLFDVSKDTKHVPLTDEQIAAMILMRMNNVTVYDKAGRWVSIPETSYGERLIIFDNNSNIINNLAKRMRCALVFRSLSRCTRSKLPRICGGLRTKPFNGLTRTAHHKFSVRSRHTSAGGASMHHSCSSQRTREGVDKFCDLPGVQEFFNEIDNLFFNEDRGMCRIFRDVRPEGERICGSSFLMAVVNSGGTGPHVDGEDWPDGCCCVAPFGTGWTGGELVFRDLGLGFQLHPGDVIFFRSAELVHENLAVKGNRRSIVMTTDRNSFTGTGQPLDPSKLALIEATLLSINARYNKLSTTERERLLVEQLG